MTVPNAAPAHVSPHHLAPHAVAASSSPETSPGKLEAVAARVSSSLGTRAGDPLPPPLLPLAVPSLAAKAGPQDPHWQLLQVGRKGSGPHSGAAGSLCCRPAPYQMSAMCLEGKFCLCSDRNCMYGSVCTYTHTHTHNRRAWCSVSKMHSLKRKSMHIVFYFYICLFVTNADSF